MDYKTRLLPNVFFLIRKHDESNTDNGKVSHQKSEKKVLWLS